MTGGVRHELLCKIASGGAASVYVARVLGTRGLEDLVALKRPHAHLLEVPGFRDAFFAEGRIASRIRHPNVVAVHEVAPDGDSVRLVMDYVDGASLAAARAGQPVPAPIALRLLLDAAAGLHAAHEATGEDGAPLRIIHRDVSPQNLLVGTDGVCRITDFGIAKCLAENTAETTQGLVKGKVAYMAPEQVRAEPLDRRADVFALGVVAWELLAGARLFRGGTDAETIRKVLELDPEPPSRIEPSAPPALDAVVLRALAKERDVRHATAEELAAELRAAIAPASHADVARWLVARAGPELERRRAELARADAVEATADLAAPPVAHATPVEPRRRGRITIAIAGAALCGLAGAAALAIGTRAPPAAPAPVATPSDEAPGAAAPTAEVTATATTTTPVTAKPAARPARKPARPAATPSAAGHFKAPRNPYE